MIYSEFTQLTLPERRTVLRDRGQEFVDDLHDQVPFILPAYQEEKGRMYFDDADELYSYLLKYHVPLSSPWLAAETVGHELAHATCALAVGAVGVRYSVTPERHLGSGVFAHAYGPAILPNLAYAAIAAYPYDSAESNVDSTALRDFGYSSRQEIIERTARWNAQGYALVIPEPKTEPLMYAPK